MHLSISIVAYNRPALLYRALNSLEIQENKNWQLVIVNDNSSNPDVEPMSIAFVKQYHGVYINSRVEESERLNKARAGVCINLAMSHLRGDVFLHIADDMELVSGAVGIILDHFEHNPTQAGYFGIGYRLADFRTGHIYFKEETEKFFRENLMGRDATEFGTGGFASRDTVMRGYPVDYPYGNKLTLVSTFLDGGQIAYRRENAIVFPEDKSYWLGEDAAAFQQISDNVGGLMPIGDVNTPLVYSNINEASLSVQRDPAKSIAVTNTQYIVSDVEIGKAEC